MQDYGQFIQPLKAIFKLNKDMNPFIHFEIIQQRVIYQNLQYDNA